MSYHSFLAPDGTEHGSFEVFYLDEMDCDERNRILVEEYFDDYWDDCVGCEESDIPEIHADIIECEGGLKPGWYWWACFPGCLPDGDPMGPFETEQFAWADAQGFDDGRFSDV